MITYTIEHCSGYAGMSKGVIAVRKRRDAAQRALYAAVYEMLRAASLLDQPIAVKLAYAANNANIYAPRDNRPRSWTIPLFDERLEFIRVTAHRA